MARRASRRSDNWFLQSAPDTRRRSLRRGVAVHGCAKYPADFLTEVEVDHRDSGAVGRAETKAAREAERSEAAAAVWADVERERRARDERTARLRAQRLAREAAKAE